MSMSIQRWWTDLERQPRATWWLSAAWLVLVCGIAFFWQLGALGPLDKDEASYIEMARQMVLRGDWLTPYRNGVPWFDKPPLAIWQSAGAFLLLGMHAGAARLGSAIWASLLVVSSFFVLRRFGSTLGGDHWQQERQRWLSAWIGSGIMAFNPAMLAFGRTAVMDMPLAGPLGLAMFAFFMGYAELPEQPHASDRTSRPWFLGFFGLLGLAILGKGPVALALAGLSLASFLTLTGQWHQIVRALPLLSGVGLMLLISIPWFAAMLWHHGQTYFNAFVLWSNVQRFTTGVDHPAPWHFFFPVLVWTMAPWSVYLPVAISRVFVRARSGVLRLPRRNQLGLYAVVWFTTVFVFFSVSVTKLHGYLLPAIPALCLLLALYWSEQMVGSSRPWRARPGFQLSLVANVAVLAALAGLCGLGPTLFADPMYPQVPLLLEQSGLHRLGAAEWAAGAIGLVALAIVPGGRRWVWAANIAVLAIFLTTVGHASVGLWDREFQRPMRDLGALAQQVRLDREETFLVGYKRYSALIYTDHPVRFVDSPDEVMRYTEEPIPAGGETTALVITPRPYIGALVASPDACHLIGESGSYVLVRVERRHAARPTLSMGGFR
jgi:4-amino-4-deoxy-L-arabinose transferase-like glycosyltransferase